MPTWAKVITCFHRIAHFDLIKITRHRRFSHPENHPPPYGMELLETRLMLSGAELLPAAELPSDAPSAEPVVIMVDDPSSGVSVEQLEDGSFVARPSGTGPFPAVLYNHGGLGTSVGGDLEGTCIALAEAGYMARAERRPEGISLDGQLEDVLYGLEQLRNHPDVDKSRVAVMGFSRGGLLALQAAIERPDDIDAVVLMAPAPGQDAMEETLANVSELVAPVHIYIANNDNQGRHDLVQLAEQVEQALREAGKDVQLTVYPPFAANGHELFFEVRDSYWSDVVEFLDESSVNQDPWKYINKSILGHSTVDNTLKGMSVVVDVAAELNFVPDSDVRLESGTIPEAGIDPDTGTVYLYYTVGPDGYVATTIDGGLNFPSEYQSPVHPGNKAFDPRCVRMPDVDQDGLPVWREFIWEREQGYFTSLISHDGIHYQSEKGLCYDPPNTDNVGVYTAYTTADGRVGLMYIGDKGTTTGNVRLAYSDDNGRSFQHYDDNPLDDTGTHDEGLNQRDPDAIVLDDGRIRIFTMVQGGPLAPHPGVRSVTSIYSFTSTDNGLEFTADPGVLLKPEDFTEFDVWSLNDPSVIQLSDGRYRMYVAGLISELPDASDAHWVILSATTATEGSDSTDLLQLDHVSTYEMDVGTHRPEMLVTESGQFLAVVVQPTEQDDGRLTKHRVYHFDENGEPTGESFAVTWITDDYGEPADHRAAIVGGELIIVYQSLVFDQDVPIGKTGPAEQYALNQSLMMARYSLDGKELFRGPIVAHVTDFDKDNFPDHCLVPLDNSLIISTGSKDQIKLREVSYQGEVLNTYEIPTSSSRSLSSIGNSLLRVDDRVWMFAGSGMQPGGVSGISVLELDSEFQPTELAWFFQDGEERTFPTGSLQYKGHTFVTYDVRDAQGRPLGPEESPFHPRLMVLDEELNMVMDIDIGLGEGFAHIHPTMAIVDDTLVIGWSMQAKDVDHRTPQVKLERYSLEFSPDTETPPPWPRAIEVDASDIDAIYSNINNPKVPGTPETLDLNNDGQIDQDDVTVLVQDILGTNYGDANLDGLVDLADLNLWLTSASGGWARGDFNGDNSVDLADYNIWMTGTPPGSSSPQSSAAPHLQPAAKTVTTVDPAAIPVATAETFIGESDAGQQSTIGSAATVARPLRRLNHRKYAGPNSNALSLGPHEPFDWGRFGVLNTVASMASLGSQPPASALDPIFFADALDLRNEIEFSQTDTETIPSGFLPT